MHAMCIQSVILNRKHNHEKWNGILLIKEPVNILAKWPAVTAQGLCRLGPHLRSHLSFKADGVEWHNTSRFTCIVTPKIRRDDVMQAPVHCIPLLRQSHSTGRPQYSDSAVQTRDISMAAEGPAEATLTLSRNWDSDTVFRAGVFQRGAGIVCTRSPNFLITLTVSFRAHMLCKSAHCALKDPPMGIASVRCQSWPAHQT